LYSRQQRFIVGLKEGGYNVLSYPTDTVLFMLSINKLHAVELTRFITELMLLLSLILFPSYTSDLKIMISMLGVVT